MTSGQVMDQPSTRVAVIGAGPAGVYSVQRLLKAEQVAGVDVFERLATPYGLVRYGVAPDHGRTRSVTRTLAKILGDPRVRYYGNVEFGKDISRQELLCRYKAVLYATGASVDRPLDIPGVEISGSHGGARFVAWYNGHPDSLRDKFDLSIRSVVVIGGGNVALDIARILARRPTELRGTDMPDPVLQTLENSAVEDIHLVVRGPAERAKFTPVELRELGEMDGVQIRLAPEDVAVDPDPELHGKDTLRNLEILKGWAARGRVSAPRTIHLHFSTRPIRVLGAERVEGVVLRRSATPDRGDEEFTVDAGLVLRAIGYRPTRLREVPYDEDRGVVPNVAGRVTPVNDAGLAREFVAGWLKRGPSGVIGTNRFDAVETVTTLLDDLAGDTSEPPTLLPSVDQLLAARNVQVVDWEAWLRLEAWERDLGGDRGAESVKCCDPTSMLRAALG